MTAAAAATTARSAVAAWQVPVGLPAAGRPTAVDAPAAGQPAGRRAVAVAGQYSFDAAVGPRTAVNSVARGIPGCHSWDCWSPKQACADMKITDLEDAGAMDDNLNPETDPKM